MKKIFTKNKKGFTLIELLVVIAIIGILSSIVIASLNDARNKSADAALRKSLQEFYKKTQEYAIDNNIIYTSITGGAWGPIDSAPDVLPGTSSIVKNIADNSISFSHSVHGTIKGFWWVGNSNSAIMIVAKSKNGDYLCIDTLSSSSNKIYKVRSTVTSGGVAANLCAYWE
jgi:prepilin-type N-terminal cleavage/methylation domain-containing protein